MKLLLDENLPESLLSTLIKDFPHSSHIRLLVGAGTDDNDIWELAIKGEFAIVSKDKDFADLSVVKGHPPKVIHLAVGNCSKTELSKLLANHSPSISTFLSNDKVSYMVLPL